MFTKNLARVLLTISFFFSGYSLIAQDEPFTLKKLAKESSDIVIGVPVAMNSYEKQNGKYVYTDIDILVKKKMKGKLIADDIITLTMYGGKIGDIITYVVGFPKFSLKMESFFFFKEDQVPIKSSKGLQKVYRIVGLTQGKMDIIEKEGKKIVVRVFELPLKLDENGKSISLSKNNSVKVDEMISYITSFAIK